ncbi:MAG: hypothetical protein BWY72_00975 [Bacteroidetes bacterium ADurb.Bin416]|nr:MAG: hypothetical protein BWY72_00975 [Bacteroidetes bacterium ADurb.Bin416]
MQFDEIAGWSTAFVREVIDREVMGCEQVEEGDGRLFEGGFLFGQQGLKFPFVALQEALAGQLFLESTGFFLEMFLKDGLAKFPELVINAQHTAFPVLFFNVVGDPVEALGVFVATVEQVVDRLAEHGLVGKLDVHAGADAQLPGQVAQDGLEVAVDGLHPEAGVIMDEELKGKTGVGLDGGGGEACFLDQGGCHAVGLGFDVQVREGPQSVEDAFLHFGSGLVGKGHGQGVAVTVGALQDQLDVFHGEAPGLA